MDNGEPEDEEDLAYMDEIEDPFIAFTQWASEEDDEAFTDL